MTANKKDWQRFPSSHGRWR